MNKTRFLSITASLFVTVALVFGLAASAAASPLMASVEPVYMEGNPKCTELGYEYGVKWDYPEDSTGGTYPLGSGQVTWSTDGTYVDWSSTIGVDAVIVKGGPNANVYVYDPPLESIGDSDLVSPINPNNGKPYGLSHVDFCFDEEEEPPVEYDVEVSKTAETAFARAYTWTITKVGDQEKLILEKGQIFPVNYDVTLNATYVDSDWAVAGEVTVYNPDPDNAAIIASITDELSGIGAVALECGVSFPYSLPAGETLVCTYAVAVPDGSARENTATVVMDAASEVDGGSAAAPVVFGAPTTTVDRCVDVKDDKVGNLGTVCADELPKVFEYSLDMGPIYCGCRTLKNTASFVAEDSGATGSAIWTVSFKVGTGPCTGPCTCPCVGGCTQTPAYWLTHTQLGPDPYDNTWAKVGPAQEATPFFRSGKTFIQILKDDPADNAYYILARAYIAAWLNRQRGASSTPPVDSALAYAVTFFNNRTPTSYLSAAGRTTVLNVAAKLTEYNNGVIGPGACGANGTTSATCSGMATTAVATMCTP